MDTAALDWFFYISIFYAIIFFAMISWRTVARLMFQPSARKLEKKAHAIIDRAGSSGEIVRAARLALEDGIISLSDIDTVSKTVLVNHFDRNGDALSAISRIDGREIEGSNALFYLVEKRLSDKHEQAQMLRDLGLSNASNKFFFSLESELVDLLITDVISGLRKAFPEQPEFTFRLSDPEVRVKYQIGPRRTAASRVRHFN